MSEQTPTPASNPLRQLLPWLGFGEQPAQEQAPKPDRKPLSRAQKILVGIVVTGGMLIAAIGFAGSYAAVSALAQAKHFGAFSRWFPIGVDAGIAVQLSLDLLLTGMRIPYPVIRYVAWLLTVGTIVFNAASSLGDPLAMGMHAIIPTLFISVIEAARHAVGKIAAITADRLIESPPLIRWLIDPLGTFRIWRRMRLWQLKSYNEVIAREREVAAFRTKLRARHGRFYRSKISDAESLALRLVRFGMPVADSLAKSEAEAEATRRTEAKLAAEARRQAELEAELRVGHERKQLAEAEAKRLAEIASQQRITEAEAAADLATSEALRRVAEAKAEPKPKAEAPTPNPKPQPEAARSGKSKPEPKSSPKPKPAELSGRRAQVEAEVEAVQKLIEAEGYEAVGLERVKDDFGLKHAAAYDRLKKARERHQDEQTKGTSPERRAEG
jgi:hypothetical protein